MPEWAGVRDCVNQHDNRKCMQHEALVTKARRTDLLLQLKQLLVVGLLAGAPPSGGSW